MIVAAVRHSAGVIFSCVQASDKIIGIDGVGELKVKIVAAL